MKVEELLVEAKANREKRLDTERLRRDYQRFKRLANMPSKFLHVIAKTEEGKEMGLTPRELKVNMHFTMPKNAAKAILRLRTMPMHQWSTSDINWMYRILSYIDGKLRVTGPLVDDGEPTERLKNLWAWGHVPRNMKPKRIKK